MEMISSLATAAVYVQDLNEALEFYESKLGFKKIREMGPSGCWGTLGDLPLYIEGGCSRLETSKSTSRVSFVLRVPNVALAHRAAVLGGYSLDAELQPLGDGKTFWFQFRDPAGNMLEAAGEIGV